MCVDAFKFVHMSVFVYLCLSAHVFRCFTQQRCVPGNNGAAHDLKNLHLQQTDWAHSVKEPSGQ